MNLSSQALENIAIRIPNSVRLFKSGSGEEASNSSNSKSRHRPNDSGHQHEGTAVDCKWIAMVATPGHFLDHLLPRRYLKH